MMRPLAVLLLFALPVLAGEVPDPEPRSSSELDLRKMQGTWTIVRVEQNGVDATKEKGAALFLFKKDQILINEGGKRAESLTIKLDARKTPRQIDLRPSVGGGPKGGAEVVRGIYKFQKGELIIVFNKPPRARPAKFDAGVEMKVVLGRKKGKK